MKYIFGFILLSTLLACSNQNEEDRVSTQLFYDFQVWGDAESENVFVRLQFRISDKNGKAVSLQPPAAVWLDSIPLQGDSTRFAGVFYETIFPLQAFSGVHTITVIDENNHRYREEFTFEPFSLAEKMPEQMIKKAFTLRLQNPPQQGGNFRLVLIDTSFQSADVNEEARLEDGLIAITDTQVSNLTKGPVFLELLWEYKKRLQNPPHGKGTLLLKYGIRQQFTFANKNGTLPQ